MSEKIKLQVKEDDKSGDVEEKEESDENTKKKPKPAVKMSDSEEDSKDKKPKQKSKSNIEETDSEDNANEKKLKKKSKSNIEKTDSEDNANDKKLKKKSKSNIEKTDSERNSNDDKKAKKDSKIESGVASSDVEKAQIDSLAADPMKDKTRMKLLKKIISHLCLLVFVLGVSNVSLGLIAFLFYENKNHLVLFGGLCIMQVIGAPVGWVAIKMGNRCLFLICFIINLIWIISSVILVVYYYFFNKSQYFNQEIALHVGVVVFLSASTTLAICCFIMMKRLDMISVRHTKPVVYVTPDGKASEKAKIDQKLKT